MISIGDEELLYLMIENSRYLLGVKIKEGIFIWEAIPKFLYESMIKFEKERIGNLTESI